MNNTETNQENGRKPREGIDSWGFDIFFGKEGRTYVLHHLKKDFSFQLGSAGLAYDFMCDYVKEGKKILFRVSPGSTFKTFSGKTLRLMREAYEREEGENGFQNPFEYQPTLRERAVGAILPSRRHKIFD